MMKRSFLWKTPEAETNGDSALIRSLLLDETIRTALNEDEKSVNYFLKTLSAPPALCENARYRAQILKDFQDYPLFFDRLYAALCAFDALPQQFQLEKGSISVHTAAKFGSDAKYRTSLAILIMTANMLKTTFSHLQEILALLERQSLSADAFRMLCERLHSLLEHPSYHRLNEILDLVSSTPDDYLIELQFTLNEFGKFARYDVRSFENLEIKIHEEKPLIGFIRRPGRGKTTLLLNVPASIPIDDKDNTMRNQLLGGIYNKMAEVLNRLLQGLIDEFGGLSHELRFYHVAMRLFKALDRYGVGFCYPEITENGSTEIIALKDLILTLSSYGQKEVIANDASFPAHTGGILIRGENNSGKTVYLRSVATALIFAQNGLPVLAKSARIHPQTTVCSLFASAEKTLSVGAGVGRFEEEVQALSELVDQAKRGDLIFLNEIFQTTSYKEGAKGLSEILRYLNSIGASWICVTHLSELFDLMKNSDVAMLETADPSGSTPYKLSPVINA